MPRYFLSTVLALFLTAFVGCGTSEEITLESGAESAIVPFSVGTSDNDTARNALEQPLFNDELGQGGQAEPDGNAEAIQRQIIYTATLQLIVEEFDGVPEKVETLASLHGGFVADSSLRGSSGTPRSGTWTIRVPVKEYGSFLDGAKKLGEFQSLTTESQEVTAEYYDVQARIKNKQRQEERLLKLLDEQTGKLEEVLKVEDHLSNVREETERMQGRMRVLKDLTAFSTVTLTINEIKGYVPAESPTFGNRIARAWSGTMDLMRVTGENLVVGIVAVGPWLVVLAIPVVIFIAIIRLLLRRLRVERLKS